MSILGGIRDFLTIQRRKLLKHCDEEQTNRDFNTCKDGHDTPTFAAGKDTKANSATTEALSAQRGNCFLKCALVLI